jgi:hypothetical protein
MSAEEGTRSHRTFVAKSRDLMMPSGGVYPNVPKVAVQRAADHEFLVPSTPAIDANRARVNDSLELVDGFPADQDPVDAAPERRLCGIIAQVYRIPWRPSRTDLSGN